SVLLIAAFGLGILILLYWYLKVRSVRLTITGDDMTLSRGLLSKERVDIDIREIRTVYVRQAFWQRILGTGRIEVFTGGDAAEFTLDGMPDPNFVRDYIRLRTRAPNGNVK
ncbi:MAG: PH domain-containing protein, partial [Paracoccaceae bacterium]